MNTFRLIAGIVSIVGVTFWLIVAIVSLIKGDFGKDIGSIIGILSVVLLALFVITFFILSIRSAPSSEIHKIKQQNKLFSLEIENEKLKKELSGK